MAIPNIYCAGEVMIELAPSNVVDLYRQSLAGDSYNTAVYLARSGFKVSYLTQLGDDHYSAAVIQQLASENIDHSHIKQLAGRRPGLYIINNDLTGERTFSYWREQSPAREMFNKPLSLSDCDIFYFTGITLAIARSGLTNLIALLQQLKQRGCQIIFDPNYRPSLWEGLQQARQHYRAILPFCSTVMPTLDDEQALWGVESCTQCHEFYQDFSVNEVVIKAPQLWAEAYTATEHCRIQAQTIAAVDTTGAGDSFNAAYIAARIKQLPITQAIKQAQALSAQVVQHRGAIIPRHGLPQQHTEYLSNALKEVR